MEWREYHEFTKHTVEKLRRVQHYLDWANLPNPYRHYQGVPLLDLPADPPPPQISALQVLEGTLGNTVAKDGVALFSQLLFYSASISAIKRAAASTYALRVNPSSGNLHPTEFHFCTRGLVDWPDGRYHYRPSSHMAEQRATGDFVATMTDTAAPIVFVLTSIAWREAWKYTDRAYRYCLHDIGHAWQALSLTAQAMGCETFAMGRFADDKISESCLLSEDEWPMLIITLHGSSIPVTSREASETVLFGGEANQLSEEIISYPRIEKIQAATKVLTARGASAHSAKTTVSGGIELPPPILTKVGFGEVVRMRRSALDFRGGDEFMSLAQLSTLLASTATPFRADFATHGFVQLYLYVHRVNGLVPGVYRYWPEHARLEEIRLGDQRLVAAALSLGQDLAGNACVAFSMIGDFERATQIYGDRGYRYVHFEAGAIGQRMYIAAEALGLRATGIGAFFDDQVHRYLGIASEQGQVVYHFALGHAVRDPRLEA